MSVCLGWFMERSGVLPTPSLLTRKVWVPVMLVCACPIHCKVHWRVGRRQASCRFISAQPLIVNHQLYKLCSVGIGGSVFLVYRNTVYIKSKTARFGGRLLGVNWSTLCKECCRGRTTDRAAEDPISPKTPASQYQPILVLSQPCIAYFF